MTVLSTTRYTEILGFAGHHDYRTCVTMMMIMLRDAMRSSSRVSHETETVRAAFFA